MQKIVSLLFSGLCAFAFASFGQKCPPPAAPVTIQATIVRYNQTAFCWWNLEQELPAP